MQLGGATEVYGGHGCVAEARHHAVEFAAGGRAQTARSIPRPQPFLLLYRKQQCNRYLR